MKKKMILNLLLSAATAAAISSMGCGSSDQGQNNAAPGAGSSQIAPPGANTVPAGNYCYYQNGYQPTCGACPQGFTQTSPNTCTAATSGNNLNCTSAGYQISSWNACVPQDFMTPPGGAVFSWQYGGFVVSSPVTDYRYSCSRQGYFYICRYTYNSPYPHYYFNGWAWVYH